MPQSHTNGLFFVVGTGRCGSTLLQAMLSSHPGIYIPPELRYFGRHEPGVRFSDPLRDEDVEAYLALCARDPWWRDMGMDEAQFRDTVRSGTRTSRQIYLWLLGHVAARRGSRKRRLGEKTPYYIHFAEHIAEIFPDAQFIQLHRDPRDVVASYLEQYWVKGGTALRVANYVRHEFRLGQQVAKRLGPDRFCTVKYEDLVEEPERELRRLCAFLGEDYHPAMLQFGDREDAGYLDVEESWKGMTRQKLTRARVGRYRTRLTPRQIWTVEERLSSILPQLGYERGSPAAAPVYWHGALWVERIYLKALHTLGVRRGLLDEQAVLSRRKPPDAVEASR